MKKRVLKLIKIKEEEFNKLHSKFMSDYGSNLYSNWLWGGVLPEPPLKLRQLRWEISTLKELLQD